MFNNIYEKDYCSKCNKFFTLKFVIYPSNIDEKRDSYITCPYCLSFVRNIHLKGNEDVSEMKD